MKIVLFQPEIAFNVGNIARTCSCLQSELHIIHPCGFPFDDRKFKRASMDYGQHLSLTHHESWAEFQKTEPQARIILLDTKASISYWNFSFLENDFLMAGQESSGVPDHIFNEVEHKIFIPMNPHTRSLNVAVSVGIVLSEAIRQTKNSLM